jgi:hypothetical protein
MAPHRSVLPVLALLLLAACATTPPPRGQIVTSAQANRAGLGAAATAPLRDLDLLRTRIPPVLLDALKDPYRRPSPYTCPEIRALIIPLDDALGADYDRPPSRGEPDLVTRASDAVLGAAAGAAQDAIPLRSWVRRMSGAERHDRLVSAAINAGTARRAYLKGAGEARNCQTTAGPRPGLFPF